MPNDIPDGAHLGGAGVGQLEIGENVFDEDVKGFIVPCCLESFDESKSGDHPGEAGWREGSGSVVSVADLRLTLSEIG